MENKTSKYTYIAFATEVQDIINGKIEVTPSVAKRINEKAQNLIDTNVAKQMYNIDHPKKSGAKGASEATKATASLIRPILNQEGKTAKDISEELGVPLTALQVANAVKFIDGVESIKVIREVVSSTGLKAQKQYTAYIMQ